MENRLFQFGNHEVRVVVAENNEPMFVAKDVCNVLGYSNDRDAIIRHCKSEGVVKHDTLTNGGMQGITLINEGNLYRLILKSKKKEAEEFETWVCDEVLPSIRKHGAYLTDNTIENVLLNPDLLIGLATQLKNERAEKLKLQKQISIQSAKIEFIDRVLDADEKIDIGQCAKILELPFGRNTLFKELRERGVFFKSKNEPKQLYIDKGYFQLKEKWIERNSHDSFMIIKILVTQRGLGYLSTLFKSEPSSKKLIQLS